MENCKRGIFVYIELTEIVNAIVYRINRQWLIKIFERSLYGVTLKTSLDFHVGKCRYL